VEDSLCLLEGYRQLHEASVLLPALGTTAPALAQHIMITLFDNAANYSPLQLLFATKALDLALSLHFNLHELLKLLLVLCMLLSIH
jgi:hypothetical protein